MKYEHRRELVIGMDGYIGRHLCARLPEAKRTTRREVGAGDPYYFDLGKQGMLPHADIVYICAGVNGTETCARDPQRNYRINVDGTIYVCEHYRDAAFVVWISSTTVEWLLDHYGQQKRIVENHLRTLPHVGMVRAGRIDNRNVKELCELMIDIGRNCRRGIVIFDNANPYVLR